MTNVEVAFYDSVVDDIQNFIAAHAPERGGALVGPIGQPIVSRFVPDPDASVTSVTFTPSANLQHAVESIERSNSLLEFKGIIHSHPSGFDQPSGGDLRAFTNKLRRAPWLGRFICPIVTSSSRRGRVDRHELQLPSGVISVYVAEARPDGLVDVQPGQPRIIPISSHTETLCRMLNAHVDSASGFVAIEGALYGLVSLRAAGVSIAAVFPSVYPTLAPILLLTPNDQGNPGMVADRARRLIGDKATDTVALPLCWNLNDDESSRLESALVGALAAGHEVTGRGPFASTSTSDLADVARTGIRARLEGATGSISAARVLIVGLGSGGSQTAEALTRASVERFTLIDPDSVAPENLSRSVYQLADVGLPKADALAARLRSINPAVVVESVPFDIKDVPKRKLAHLIRNSDIVIAATDDPKAQMEINHRAWSLGVPVVFGGVYAGGKAGEVIFTVPGQTHCYRCAAANRHARAGDRSQMNYGTGQLLAEPALGSDITHVVSASVKVAVGLLEMGLGDQGHSAGTMVAAALGKGYQFIITSTVAEYDFFPKIFANTPAQHAYQSVWMSVQGDRACPTCGTDPLPVEADLFAGPNLSALQPIHDTGESTSDTRDHPSAEADASGAHAAQTATEYQEPAHHD